MDKKKSVGKPFGTIKNVNIVNINLNKILIILALIFLGTTIFNFFKKGLDGNEIPMTSFITNIKENKYSKIDIKDDGKAVAVGKSYMYVRADESIQFADMSDVALVKEDEIKVIDSEKLYSLIEPLDFQSSFLSILNPSEYERVKELVIGSDFVLALSTTKSTYLVESFGLNELRAFLSEKGMVLENLPLEYVDLANEGANANENDIISYYNNGRFSYLWQAGDVYVGALIDEEITQDFVYWKTSNETMYDFASFLQQEGISFDSPNARINLVQTFQIPWGDIIITGFLGILIVMAIFMFRGIQSSGSGLMKFGQSKARMFFGRKPDTTFKDVAGIEEAKEELKEIVLFLKDPRRFTSLGARIPKGVLMVGAPGTGKTLLARAIAGEAGVPFFHTSGSEFEEMLVGAGASRVRDLFDKAKRAAPSLIFIDEIDAVARKRGTTVQSGTTEQTLNQILVEMDGFERNANVIVIAATNRPDVLDPAILRPGRFDRRIVLDLPDIEGRKEIIALHARNKPIGKDVDMEVVAKRTVGFSGADIENMLNEAAIIVAKDNRKEIVMDDLEEAATKVQVGPEKKRKRTQKEIKMTAYHEAGHAMVMKLLPDSDPVHRVTIVSRGMSLGYTLPLPDSDQLQMTKTQMLSKIKSLLAGFITEDITFGDVTSGAANDIEKATNIARKMVKHFGMSKRLGMVKYGQDQDLKYLGYGYGEARDYSEETSKIIDEEVLSIINSATLEVRKLIKENGGLLDRIVNTLMEKETLDAAEFNAFFK